MKHYEYAFVKACKYASDEAFEHYVSTRKITARNANHHEIVRKLRKYGDVNKFKRYIDRFEFSPSAIFEVFCQHCDFTSIQWLITALNWTSEDVERDCEYSIAPIINSSLIEFKNWIISFFNISVEFMFYTVFPIIRRFITFENLSWLFDKYNVSAEDILGPYQNILTGADADVIQQTIDWFCIGGDDAKTFIDNYERYKDVLRPYDIMIKSAAKLS